MAVVTALDACITVSCLSLTYVLYTMSRLDKHGLSQAYILQNQVTHARLLPVDSSHSFTYPTLSLLLSLDALERNALDVGGGWVFGYGGLWGRLTGLRSCPYLTNHGENLSIRKKLEQVLMERGLFSSENMLEDAWIMTMPSFLGYEGINPLTVYFCYKPGGKFWLTVLEIHNTFGESHVHVLEVGNKEDDKPSKGYDHQWTFLREFHVSPFNDRSGFYTVSVKSPSHPPTITTAHPASPQNPPRPAVRVHLYTASKTGPAISLGPLKLTALLRPISSTPLSVKSLLFALSCAPFALFLSFPRILYHAWILHYQKRLDVFLRPEPHPVTLEWGTGTDPDVQATKQLGGGVKWLGEGILEKFARRRVENFLSRRVDESGIPVTLISADPSVPRRTFSPALREKETQNADAKAHLTISYLSSRFFTILFLSPSATHALLLGCTTERIFFPSSADLFVEVFSPPPTLNPQSDNSCALSQRIRIRAIPPLLLSSTSLPIPSTHPLDATGSTIITTTAVWTLLFLERLEEWVFNAAHARPVKGDEPWKQWQRAADASLDGRIDRMRDVTGSVRRYD